MDILGSTKCLGNFLLRLIDAQITQIIVLVELEDVLPLTASNVQNRE